MSVNKSSPTYVQSLIVRVRQLHTLTKKLTRNYYNELRLVVLLARPLTCSSTQSTRSRQDFNLPKVLSPLVAFEGYTRVSEVLL